MIGIRKLFASKPLPDAQDISSAFLLNLHKVNPGLFRESRYFEESMNGDIVLIHIIKMPPNFKYANLNGLNAQSALWRDKLRKYACARTHVQWRFIPDTKQIRIDATVSLHKSHHSNPVDNLDKTVECLREWLCYQCKIQDIPLSNSERT